MNPMRGVGRGVSGRLRETDADSDTETTSTTKVFILNSDY